jgi:quercetin dioxygenase-like cupin family protein
MKLFSLGVWMVFPGSILALLPGQRAHAQQAEQPVEEAVWPIVVGGEELEANYVEVRWAPGASSSPHRHAGPVFGLVLEGTLYFAVDEEPEREISAGESFVESEGALHRVSRGHPDTGARAVVVILAEPGATLTGPP